MPCRAKKAKCSGDKPTCTNCERFRLECTWPEGRKRKRTRKEMEADFGKRPAPGLTENGGPSGTRGIAPKAVTSDPPPTERSESTASGAQPFAEVRPSEPTRYPYQQPEVNQASRNGPGFQQDPSLAQSMRFGSGQTFSPQSSNGMFFPHAATTGFQLQHPPLPPIDDMQAPFGTERMNTGSAGTGTPHTIWQFLASLPAQNSLLPSFGQGEDGLQSQLSAMEQSLESGNPYPQYPLATEQQYLPHQHLPQQSQQLMSSSNDFLPFNPPSRTNSVSEKRSNGGTGKEPQTEAQKTPTDVAGSATGTPSMSGLMKAITNQIGYLEGDESKPYLKLSYFRVAGSTCEFRLRFSEESFHP